MNYLVFGLVVEIKFILFFLTYHGTLTFARSVVIWVIVRMKRDFSCSKLLFFFVIIIAFFIFVIESLVE